MVSVAILGAGGGIGQPLSLLLKLNQHISRLNLYGLTKVPGTAADVSHINTTPKVKSFVGESQLNKALQDIDLVIIAASAPRKPGMARSDLLVDNTKIFKSLVGEIANTCPNAIISIITNPLNSMIAVAAEILKSKGVYNPRRLFGITTLDSIRASCFACDIRPENDPTSLYIPIVGGHSGTSIVPLLSLANPSIELTEIEAKELVYRIQFGGVEVIEAKNNGSAATLSTAYAVFRFVNSILCSFVGNVAIEPALISLEADPKGAKCIRDLGVGDVEFFAVPILLGRNGVEKIIPIESITTLEAKAIKVAANTMKKNIDMGINCVKGL